eukprot:scaffold165733_cov17-Tisochrysis_lutea.AAC.2
MDGGQMKKPMGIHRGVDEKLMQPTSKFLPTKPAVHQITGSTTRMAGLRDVGVTEDWICI